MDVTDTGIVTDVRAVQPEKACVPIEATELPIVTDVKFEQPLNV